MNDQGKIKSNGEESHNGIRQIMVGRWQGPRSTGVAAFLPRLWAVLLVLAIPFIMVCAEYLEALERTGRAGAIIADTLLPAIIAGYIAMIVVLKRRRI